MTTSQLNNRQKLLYGALAVIGILYVGDVGYRKLLSEPNAETERQLTGLTTRLRDQKLSNAKAKKSLASVDELQKVALPRDLELARSGYQAWLLQMVKDCKISAPKVDSGEPTPRTYRRQLLYNRFVFSVRGRGNLRQATQLLHKFYSAGHLHKIQSLTLTPNSISDQLDIAVSIEALSLPGADRSAELTAQPSDRLAMKQLADYRVISNRNFFQTGGDSIASQVRLSAITTDRLGKREAWFSGRAGGTTQRRRESEALECGVISVTLLDVADKHVVVMIDGRKCQLPIGASLAEAEPFVSTE